MKLSVCVELVKRRETLDFCQVHISEMIFPILTASCGYSHYMGSLQGTINLDRQKASQCDAISAFHPSLHNNSVGTQLTWTVFSSTRVPTEIPTEALKASGKKWKSGGSGAVAPGKPPVVTNPNPNQDPLRLSTEWALWGNYCCPIGHAGESRASSGFDKD